MNMLYLKNYLIYIYIRQFVHTVENDTEFFIWMFLVCEISNLVVKPC